MYEEGLRGMDKDRGRGNQILYTITTTTIGPPVVVSLLLMLLLSSRFYLTHTFCIIRMMLQRPSRSID